MKKYSDLEAMAEGATRRWSEEHTLYACHDGINVLVPSVIFRIVKKKDRKNKTNQGEGRGVSALFLRNGLQYRMRPKSNRACWLTVAKTMFNRNMSQLMHGASNARTITFPNTIRATDYNACEGN